MIENGKFYITLGASRLVDEFRTAAGCKTTQQAVDAIFNISSTLIADRLAGIKYIPLVGWGKWDFVDQVESNLFSPEYGDLIGDKKKVEMSGGTPRNFFQIGVLEAQAEDICALHLTPMDAFALAVLMAKDLHDKFGDGKVIKIPVHMEKGNPLEERHIHLAP